MRRNWIDFSLSINIERGKLGFSGRMEFLTFSDLELIAINTYCIDKDGYLTVKSSADETKSGPEPESLLIRVNTGTADATHQTKINNNWSKNVPIFHYPFLSILIKRSRDGIAIEFSWNANSNLRILAESVEKPTADQWYSKMIERAKTANNCWINLPILRKIGEMKWKYVSMYTLYIHVQYDPNPRNKSIHITIE